MTRIAVGPMWSDASESDRKDMVEVFGRYMTTMYAARFKGFAGEDTSRSPIPRTATAAGCW